MPLLPFTADDTIPLLRHRGVERLKRALRSGPLSEEASFYNKDEHFASAVQRALELKREQVEAMTKLSVTEPRIDLRRRLTLSRSPSP